jgi:hypothetical protein
MNNPYSLRSVISGFTRSTQKFIPAAQSFNKLTAHDLNKRTRHPSFSVVGVLERGEETRYSIDGVDFWVSDDSWIVGTPALGVVASVSGQILSDGRHLAKKIIIRAVGS